MVRKEVLKFVNEDKSALTAVDSIFHTIARGRDFLTLSARAHSRTHGSRAA